MTSPELRAAGFDPECDDCHDAVARGWEACDQDYIPVHERISPRECPTCGGVKDPYDDVCGRCRGADAA